MSVGRASAAAATAAAAAVLLAGCGAAHAGGSSKPTASLASPLTLSTSASAAKGSGFAVVEMGGSSAQHDNFWEVFTRPAPAGKWTLITPAAVADNGGLVVANAGAGALAAGFLPSQDLKFSPVAASDDAGARWSPSAPVDPGLAQTPDALAAGPGHVLIALTTSGSAQLGSHLGSAWTSLTSERALARTPAGRACGLTRLTTAALTSGGTALLAGDCTKHGVAGIFGLRGGHWQAAGPALPASMARSQISVLGLSTTGTQTTALLQAGAGSPASVVAAWAAGSGPHWTLSAPLQTGAAGVKSAALWTGGAAGLVLGGNRGDVVAGPGHSWQQLATLPAGTQTLAAGTPGQYDALVAERSTLTDWQLPRGAASWKVAQTVKVAIPYGSSG
jgi:hypothetical protein